MSRRRVSPGLTRYPSAPLIGTPRRFADEARGPGRQARR
jgi:hypothetical protein